MTLAALKKNDDCEEETDATEDMARLPVLGMPAKARIRLANDDGWVQLHHSRAIFIARLAGEKPVNSQY
jgi:hypothetical protein